MRGNRTRKRESSRSKQLGIVVAAVAVVGAGGWFAGAQMQSPADAAAAHQPPKAGPVTVAVEHRSLTASVVAQGSVEFASPQGLSLAGPVGSAGPGSGGASGGDGGGSQLVTKLPAVGKEVKEGDVLMQVSGRPVLVLRGSVPMYRTLGPGTSGDDVKQLERALARLGFDPGTITGKYTQQDATAVVRWYKSKGFAANEPSVADKQQLGTLQQAVTAAQQALLDARSGDGKDSRGSSHELQVKSAQQQLNTANQALSAFQASYGTKVPAGEVIFLSDLPARLDKVSVKLGEAPSGPIGTVTSSRVVVQAVVPGSDAKLLHKGMTAEVETAGGKTVEGRVVAMGDDVPKEDASDGKDGTDSGSGGGGSTGSGDSAPVPVQISLPTGELSKDAGGTAKVTICVGSSDGEVLTVPIAALHTSADGQAKVRVKRDGSTLDVPVKAGLSAQGQVEVTPVSGGLKPSDQVVVGQ
ncbi:peptidoglycan-binding protein [Streptomyces griseoluteus]|uniref:peptidoglycan-binding protein n=1 Tax=Streptomyces griseoluteus TaxID=29306 RepID=UPI0038219BE5